MPTQTNNTMVQSTRIRAGHNILSSVDVVQGDTNRELHFIFDDYLVPRNAELRVYIKKPSGKEIYNYASLVDDEVVVHTTYQMAIESGENWGQLQIITDGLHVTSFPFIMNVEENLVHSSSITSSDDFFILDQLIDEARTRIAEMIALHEQVTAQESARVTAENIRIESENQRQIDSATAVQNCNTAIQNMTTKCNNTLADTVKKCDTTIQETNKNTENAINRIDEKNAEITTSESQRVSAENKRISNENKRISDENKRQEDTSNAIKDCEDAVQDVNIAMKALDGAISGVINDNATSNVTTFSSQKMISNFIQNTEKGSPNGVATLNEEGKLPVEQIGVIDKEYVGLGNVPNVTTDDQIPTFAQSDERTNIDSGDKMAVLFGKISKWFDDLKAVAFSGSYDDLSDKPELGDAATKSCVNNLTTTEEGFLLDARAGKTLQDNMSGIIKIQNKEISATVNTNSYYADSIDVNDAPGYKPVGIIGCYFEDNFLSLANAYIGGNKRLYYSIRNHASYASNNRKANFDILYIRE